MSPGEGLSGSCHISYSNRREGWEEADKGFFSGEEVEGLPKKLCVVSRQIYYCTKRRGCFFSAAERGAKEKGLFLVHFFSLIS